MRSSTMAFDVARADRVRESARMRAEPMLLEPMLLEPMLMGPMLMGPMISAGR